MLVLALCSEISNAMNSHYGGKKGSNLDPENENKPEDLSKRSKQIDS